MVHNKRSLAIGVLVGMVLLLSLFVTASVYAKRMNPKGSMGIVYVTSIVQVYTVEENNQGVLVLDVTRRELRKFKDVPKTNTLIKASTDGKFVLYHLSSGEYQVNIGPDDDGKMEEVIWRGIPAEGPATIKYWNVKDVLFPHQP